MNKKDYFKLFSGALVGAFIGAMPWILAYVFLDFKGSFLATLIPYCSYEFVKYLKVKETKKSLICIFASSILVVILSGLVLIPMISILKSGSTTSLRNLQIYYNKLGFYGSFSFDSIIIVLFVFIILGIFMFKGSDDLYEKIYSVDIPRKKRILMNIIRVLILLFIGLGIYYALPKDVNKLVECYDYSNNIEFGHPKNYVGMSNVSDAYTMFYYPKNDLTGKSGYIYINLYYIVDENGIQTEKVRKDFYEKFESYNIVEKKDFITDKGFEASYLKVESNDIDYIFYGVIIDNKIVIISSLCYKDSIPHIDEDTLKIVNSLKEIR